MVTSHAGKMPENISVAEVALSFPSAHVVFQKYDIDYCCGGHQSFATVCQEFKLNPEVIWEEIGKTQVKEIPPYLRVADWEPSFVVDFIEANHHGYSKRVLPEIEELLIKITEKHGENHPELEQISDDFNDLRLEMMEHMLMEERELFPALKKYFNKSISWDEFCELMSYEGNDPLNMVKHDHEFADELIRSINILTHQYTPPSDACASFRLAYQKLAEFERDLKMHIFLENSVLFEKMQKL